MLGDHLPEDVACVVATEAMQSQALSDEEEACIANAVEKRKREFRGGRHAARAALRQLGFSRDIVLLPAAGSRRPEWPAGYVGSITHTAGFCAAIAARSSDYHGVGIDVEPRTALKPELLAKICTGREREWIAQQPGDQYRPFWGKTIFCIKETLYKVFNPLHHVFLGFQEAEVYFSRADGTFRAEIYQREHGLKVRYTGRFSMDDHFVYASTLLHRSQN